MRGLFHAKYSPGKPGVGYICGIEPPEHTGDIMPHYARRRWWEKEEKLESDSAVQVSRDTPSDRIDQ